MSRLDRCQVTLQADITEIGKMLDFVQQSFRVYSQTGNILARVADAAELRNLLIDYRDNKVTEINSIYQLLFVQVWSAFESFVRNLIVSYLDEFCGQRKDFSTLDKYGLIKRNLLHTGIAFQQIFENRANVVIDFFTLARNVATGIPAAEKVALNSSTFAFFLKSPNSEGIRDALRRIGITSFDWDKIGAAPEVQKALGTNRTTDTSKAIEAYLESAVRIRNNVVHRGEGLASVSETDVRQAMAVLESLGVALKQFLQKDYEQKCT